MIRVFALLLAMGGFASNAAMAQDTQSAPPPPPASPEAAPAPTAEAAPEAAPEVAPEAAPETASEAAPAPPAEAAAEPTDAPPEAPVEPAAETPTPAPAPKVWERCGVLYAPSPGAVSSKVVDGEHVADLADGDAFVLPADAPANVLAVQCARDAILPEHNDYKVLLAGFPFSILTKDNRVAVLDVDNAKIRLRTLQGSFTPEEQARVQDYLDEAQFAFDKAKAEAAKKKP